MKENKTITISPTTVFLNEGEWFHGAKAEIQPKTTDALKIVWKSDKDTVATVNPVNGYVYANSPGVAIITAHLENDEAISGCYTVFVENHNHLNAGVVNSSEILLNNGNTRSVCGSYSEMAFGFSGTIYSYTISGNIATLEKGGLSKRKAYNNHVATFQSAVHSMGMIYNSFSTLQRTAWLVLRGYGLLSGFSLSVIDGILLLSGVDLKDQLEATVLRMNEWYDCEERAKEAYSLF